MKIINQLPYSKNYKPNVVYGSITIKYYPIKMRSLAKDNPKKVTPHVKSYTSKLTTLTLDHNKKLPTQKLYDLTLNRIVKELKLPKKQKVFAWIDSIDVHRTICSVSYQFDQLIH